MGKMKIGMLSGLLVLAALISGPAWGRAPEPAGNILLVVPARYTVMQAAFDMARLRSIYLASYTKQPGESAWSLHVWDSQAGKWVRISLSELAGGSVFLSTPRAVVLVGTDDDIPKGLIEALAWAPKVDRVRSLLVADLVNTLNPYLRFSPKEWYWLAGRYHFKLTDRNAERRKYGRYGRPRPSQSLSPLPNPKADVSKDRVPMPPALTEPDQPAPATTHRMAPSAGSASSRPETAAAAPEPAEKPLTVREKAEILKKSLPEVAPPKAAALRPENK